MYYVNGNLNRLGSYAINSFERDGNNLLIHFAALMLSNFNEEGYQNKISTPKSVLIIKNILSESFYFNKTQEETNLTNLENDYYISGFKSIEESQDNIELEIITWKENQPYNEFDDTDYIVWKVNAKSFQLQFSQLTYY